MPNPLYDALLAPHAASRATFVTRADGTQLGYRDFHARVLRMAAALYALGLRPGDRLAVQAEKSMAAMELYGACLAAGVVFVPLNTAYTPAEIGYFLTDASPGAFVCDPSREAALAPLAAGVRPGARARLLTLAADGSGSLAALAAAQGAEFAPVPRTADDLAALLYTSGTTGRSKGAMLTQENLLSNAAVLCETWRITAADRLLHALPIFHAHGLFVAIDTTLLAGAEMIFLPAFDTGEILARLPDATTMMGVPTFYTRLLDDPRFTADLVGHMRLFVSGSAPLLAETHAAFEARTGHRILERYGMTETGMNTSNPYEGERRPGSVGFPLAGTEIRITEEGGTREVPDGEIGMVEVRGPNVFKGYWNMPEKTREELRDDGFFVTGDLGRRDADGYIHIVGRKKDLIITGGFNVYPKEVELVLDEVAWVRESAVIGVPHPDFGEGVVAVLSVLPGADPDEAGLRAEIAGQLAKYKQPKKIVVVEELPRNTMGKVQKNVLRERFAGVFAAG